MAFVIEFSAVFLWSVIYFVCGIEREKERDEWLAVIFKTTIDQSNPQTYGSHGRILCSLQRRTKIYSVSQKKHP